MDIKLPKEVTELFKKFQKMSFQLFIVGGAVRDLILKKDVQDWDFTTDAKPEEILKILPEGYYNNKFGTVGINSPLGILEITTMRKEGRYLDHRHPAEVGWTNNIEEDLARRDFTINAIALSVIPSDSEESAEPSSSTKDEKWQIIDYFAGQSDLENKLIKAVRDSNLRFQEDALRMMRAIRFSSQLGFNIEEKTFQAIKENAKLIQEIAYERIRDELFKLLASEDAYEGLLKLRESGILKLILPEVEKCFGIIQEGPKHDRIYDIGDHLFRSMRETPSKDPLVKFASLLHDIGKADTVNIEEDGNVTFYNHDVVGAHLALDIAKRFNLSKNKSDKLFKLIRWHMFSTNENQTDSAIRRFIKNVGLENIEDIMAVRIGDRLGGDTRKPVSWRMEEFQKRIEQVLEKPFSLSDLKVSGKDVMQVLGIQTGPKVGEILNKLFQEVLEDASKNNRKYLLDRIRKIG